MIKINAHRVGQVSLIRWAYKFYPLKLDSWILVRQITFLDNHLLPNYIYICPFCRRSDFGSQMSCICWFPKLITFFKHEIALQIIYMKCHGGVQYLAIIVLLHLGKWMLRVEMGRSIAFSTVLNANLRIC